MSISTLCPILDIQMRGGVQIGIVTEICGEEGVGKTCLSMQLALASHLPTIANGVTTRGCAVYVTTFHPFPTDRMRELATNLFGEQKVKDFMENVHVYHAFDPYEFNNLLNTILQFINSKVCTSSPVKVLVVDSICHLYFNRFPFTKEGTTEKNDVMKALAFALKRFATNANIAVVLCNDVVDSYDPIHVMNFKTGNRIVRPKYLAVIEKQLGSRWILSRKFNEEDGTTQRFLGLSTEDEPRCEYFITGHGIHA